jgi:hypothetical protein
MLISAPDEVKKSDSMIYAQRAVVEELNMLLLNMIPKKPIFVREEAADSWDALVVSEKKAGTEEESLERKEIRLEATMLRIKDYFRNSKPYAHRYKEWSVLW